jgi:hypothetical protein
VFSPNVVTGLLVALTSLAAEPASDADLLVLAETSFRQGIETRSEAGKGRPHFAQAAAAYEALHRQGYRNVDLYRNQGNAYLLADDLAQAILAYRRGLRFAPNDGPLLANLAYARGQVIDPGGVTRGRSSAWPRLAPGLLLGLLVLSYSLGWLSLTRWWMVRASWLLWAAAGAWVFTGLVAAAYLNIDWECREDPAHPLIVVVKDGVKLRRGNGSHYPARDGIVLNRGVEARWWYTRGAWHQIELAAGQVGWVHDGDVLIDRSSPFARRCDPPRDRGAGGSCRWLLE